MTQEVRKAHEMSENIAYHLSDNGIVSESKRNFYNSMRLRLKWYTLSVANKTSP